MEAFEAVSLVNLGKVTPTYVIGSENTTEWVWKYFTHNEENFAVRFAGDMPIAVEFFDERVDEEDHKAGWERAEDIKLFGDDDNDDEPVFVYDEVN